MLTCLSTMTMLNFIVKRVAKDFHQKVVCDDTMRFTWTCRFHVHNVTRLLRHHPAYSVTWEACMAQAIPHIAKLTHNLGQANGTDTRKNVTPVLTSIKNVNLKSFQEWLVCVTLKHLVCKVLNDLIAQLCLLLKRLNFYQLSRLLILFTNGF